MDTGRCVLLIQVAATWAMVGIIWFVQVVHYPLMGQVGPTKFIRYEFQHRRLTGYVVGPLMLVELFSTIGLFRWRPDAIPTPLVVAGATLLSVIWIGTYTVQVPQHAALSQQFAADVHGKLVAGNWLRTVCWSTRGMIALEMLRRVIA